CTVNYRNVFRGKTKCNWGLIFDGIFPILSRMTPCRERGKVWAPHIKPGQVTVYTRPKEKDRPALDECLYGGSSQMVGRLGSCREGGNVNPPDAKLKQSWGTPTSERRIGQFWDDAWVIRGGQFQCSRSSARLVVRQDELPSRRSRRAWSAGNASRFSTCRPPARRCWASRPRPARRRPRLLLERPGPTVPKKLTSGWIVLRRGSSRRRVCSSLSVSFCWR